MEPLGSVDDRHPASPYIDMDVLYYQNSYIFGKHGLDKVMQDFYHQPWGFPYVYQYCDGFLIPKPSV